MLSLSKKLYSFEIYVKQLLSFVKTFYWRYELQIEISTWQVYEHNFVGILQMVKFQ